jgi:amino acid transporter
MERSSEASTPSSKTCGGWSAEGVDAKIGSVPMTADAIGKTAPTTGANNATGAKPTMGLWSVTSLGIGAMVGAGIFALLGQAAAIAGNLTYVSFLLGGLVAVLSGYSYAQLAMRYPDAGGVETYFDRAFGGRRLSGTLSLIYLVTMAFTVALVAKAFGAYAAPLLLGNTDALWIDVFASGLIVVMTLLNFVGAGSVGKAEIALVAIKLVILAGLMIAGAVGMMGHAPIAQAHSGLANVIGCVGLTFLAYAGYSVMANAAGSVKKPRRTIPAAIYLAIGAVIVLYTGLAVVVLASVSPAQLAANSDVAVAEAARPLFGNAGYVIVSIGALLATASGVNAWIFSALEMSKAEAKATQLPRIFRKIVWRKGTQGLLVLIAIVLLLTNVFDLSALANIASITFLITYLAVHVANWQLSSETKSNTWVVAAGFLSMAVVLAFLLWTTVAQQPWAAAVIVVLVAASWGVESYLMRKLPPQGSQVRTER